MNDIVDPTGIDRRNQADATSKLILARIAQHLAARAQHDWELAGIDLEAFDQPLGFNVRAGIECLIGMAIAGQKPLQSNDVPILCGTNYHGTASF